MHMIKFEWKKLCRLRVFISFLLMTILLIACLFIRNDMQQDMVKAERVEFFRHHSSEVTSQLVTDQKRQSEIGEGADSRLEESIEVGKTLYAKLQDLITHITEDGHMKALQLENDVYELAMHYQSLDKRYPMSQPEMEDEIKLNNKLLKNELPKENLAISIQPAVFMKQTVQLFVNTFGFFILLVIIGTPIAREFDDETIKLTYVLPISSTRMVVSKWISLVLAGMAWLFVVFLSAYTISRLFGSEVKNPFNYPFFTKDMTFISAGDYVQQSIIFSVIYLFVLMSVFICLSFLVKNTLIVHIVLFILFSINVLVIKKGGAHPLLPWSYQDLDFTVLQHEAASWLGAIFSFLVTIIMLLLAIKASQRRDYQS